MFRKLVIGVAMLALGSWLWMGNTGSYVRTFWSEATDYVESKVPIETQIKVARQKLKEFAPDIERARRQIAEQEVAVRKLERDIREMEVAQNESREKMVALRDRLEQNLASYQIGRTQYTREELRNDLNKRFESFKAADERIGIKNATLRSYVQTLEANQAKVLAMLNAKEKLESKVADLEARLRMVEAQKAGEQFQIDDTEAASIHQLIDQIDQRIEVEQKMLDAAPLRQIPDKDIAPTDLESQIDQYLGREPEAKSTSASL